MSSPYLDGFFAGLRPDTRLTVSEWADNYRILPMKSAKEAGKWRTARTPYLKEIMDCLSPSSPVEKVVFMKGAQVGGPLALDTPIPTVGGWTTMGNIEVGDRLFDEKGQPCRVQGYRLFSETGTVLLSALMKMVRKLPVMALIAGQSRILRVTSRFRKH